MHRKELSNLLTDSLGKLELSREKDEKNNSSPVILYDLGKPLPPSPTKRKIKRFLEHFHSEKDQGISSPPSTQCMHEECIDLPNSEEHNSTTTITRPVIVYDLGKAVPRSTNRKTRRFFRRVNNDSSISSSRNTQCTCEESLDCPESKGEYRVVKGAASKNKSRTAIPLLLAPRRWGSRRRSSSPCSSRQSIDTVSSLETSLENEGNHEEISTKKVVIAPVPVPSKSVTDMTDIEILAQRYPHSTLMERKRFMVGRNLERGMEKMNLYMQWREKYQLDDSTFRKPNPTFKTDKDVWDWAVNYAARHYQGGSVKLDLNLKEPGTLPRIVRFGDVIDLKALDGRRIVQVLPGMLDKTVAPQDFYSLCVAIYLDLKLDRESNETIHVFVDLRAGKNWPNAAPTVLMPFVKDLTSQLADNMPERMISTIVYPVPSLAKPIWALFKGFIPSKIVNKIKVLWGPSGVKSPIPKTMMKDGILDEHTLEQIEKYRVAEFL